MDYEIKIYLDKLIEAVEELNSPDWWTIGITVVNALIMIWLGWKQYKLQEQQYKLARYDENIALYNNMNRIHRYVQHIFMDINFTLENLKYHRTRFDKEITTFKELRKWFIENESNLRFRVKMTDEEYHGYLNFLYKLEDISFTINEYINKKDVINTELKSNSNEWILDDNARINAILSHIVTEEKIAIKNLLLDAKTAKEYVLNHSILKRLQKLCTL